MDCGIQSDREQAAGQRILRGRRKRRNRRCMHAVPIRNVAKQNYSQPCCAYNATHCCFHQTYQSERPDHKHLGCTNRNSVSYTEMCDRGDLPTTAIFETSNGKIGTDGMPWRMKEDLSICDSNVLGSTCLSSEILFRRHFVPLLRPIVKTTQVHLLKRWTSVRADKEFE